MSVDRLVTAELLTPVLGFGIRGTFPCNALLSTSDPYIDRMR